MIDTCLDGRLATALARESPLLTGRFEADDRLEGTTAFVEKHALEFTGG